MKSISEAMNEFKKNELYEAKYKNKKEDYYRWLVDSKEGQGLEDDSSDYEFAIGQFGSKDKEDFYYNKFLAYLKK